MWYGHVAGESASWALGAAEGWLIFNLAETNPSSWVGALFLAAMLPWLVVPVFVGMLTDRFSRRDILALAYAVSILHSLALAVLIFTGVIQVWHVLILALINGSARAVHMGAIESLAANLVPGRDLPNAYALVNAGYYATRLIGSRVPGSGVRGRGSGERETTASSLAGKEESSRKEGNSGQGKDGPAGVVAQGGNGR